MAEIILNTDALAKKMQEFRELTATVANEVIEEKTKEIYDGVKSLASARIHSRSGELINHINYNVRKQRKTNFRIGTIYSNAYGPKPKRPGLRNKRLSSRNYSSGAPYPKILEFSPRLGHSETNYSKFAHVYPVVDRVRPTVREELRGRLQKKYDEVYKSDVKK